MSNRTMRIELSGDHRERMIRSVRLFMSDKLDMQLSEFQAEQLIDFLAKELGAPVYNQAIRDAHAFMAERLTDLEGEFYEPEEPYTK